MRSQRIGRSSSARSIFSLRAHSSTRRARSCRTPPRPFSTRSTVATDTWAAAATSWMVVFRCAIDQSSLRDFPLKFYQMRGITSNRSLACRNRAAGLV